MANQKKDPLAIIDNKSDISYYKKALIETDFSRKIFDPPMVSCWCQGGCFYGTGDSYHYKKVMDVDCSLPLEAKKNKVVNELMTHYVEAHGIANLPQITHNVAVKCFETTSSR